ncbi:hypothetical protein ACTNDG_11010 [Clostridium sp. HCP1S3_B4]|uniref:hypothetical protein n=1 Tax=unclassified Clostridium TaxID=2614128 RepID=UPI003F8B24F5
MCILSNVNYDDENEIYYISDYHQYWLYDKNYEKQRNPEFDNYNGGYILDVKNNKSSGLNYYTEQLEKIINVNDELLNNNWIINLIPSLKPL